MYDLIGIGIGPMNLGLSALAHPTDLKTLFFDESEQFSWHPGMMIQDSMMQTSFISDLVTLADPTSAFSYLNYLRSIQRLHTFYFYEKLLISRQGYNDYLRWVATQLNDLRFSTRVVDVKDTGDSFEVLVEDVTTGKRETFEARNVVIGTGSKPAIPDTFDERVIHNTQYVMNKAELLQRKKISIVGSGQSAAEIFLDLLTTPAPERPELEWIARSTLFETLETGKLGEEIFSPSYVTYFNQLPLEVRQESVKKFARSQNGISPETLQSIYAHLYDLTEEEQQQVAIRANLEVKKITYDERFTIAMQHQELEDERSSKTDAVIAATGFSPSLPSFIDRLDIVFEAPNAWKVDADYQIVRSVETAHHLYATANLELSHGPAADNLGMSVSRNQLILNAVAGTELYPVEQHATFTTFD